MHRSIRVGLAALVSGAVVSTAVGLVGPAAPASAAVALLYSNGGLNPVAASTSGVAAPAGFSWSEAQHDAAVPSVKNTTGFGIEHGDNRLADNFTVPVGQAWTIDSFDTFAYVTTASPSPFVAATVRVWSGAPGLSTSRVLYGDTVTNRLRTSTDSLIFRISDTTGGPAPTPPNTTRKVYRNNIATAGLVLPSGEYWMDFDLQAVSSAEAFAPTVTVPGTRGLPGWNARAAVVGGWSTLYDSGDPASGANVAQDLPFNVNGTVSFPAPETLFGKTPKTTMRKKKVEFSFKSDQAGATFQCSLNGKPFVVCASKVTVKGRKGSNTLSVRAVSVAGVADASPAAYTWKYKKKKKKRHHGGGGSGH